MGLDQEDPALDSPLREQITQLDLQSGMDVKFRLLDGRDCRAIRIERSDDDRQDLRDTDADVERPHGAFDPGRHELDPAANTVPDPIDQRIDQRRIRGPQNFAG